MYILGSVTRLSASCFALLSPSREACIESMALAKFFLVFSNSSSFSCSRRSTSCLACNSDYTHMVERLSFNFVK